jgi:hypothetical protein
MSGPDGLFVYRTDLQNEAETAAAAAAREKAQAYVDAFVERAAKTRSWRVRVASFLDGFALAGFFGRLGIPGSPTQVFADSEPEEKEQGRGLGAWLEMQIGGKKLHIALEPPAWQTHR